MVKQADDAQRQRRYDVARALYLRARSEAPDPFSRAYAGRSLGLALLFWGEYAGAETALEQVLQARPDDVASWHDLGILRHRRGDLLGAETCFRKAIELRKHNPRSRIALAALLWKARRWRDALGEYQALLRLELPSRVRNKVQWAIGVLQRRVKSSLQN